MAPLKTFRIEFDRPNATYLSGEHVSGNIVIEVGRAEEARGITFGAEGQARVHWSAIRRRSDGRSETERYRNFEEYFHFKSNVIGTGRSDSRVTIPVGINKYPFGFLLPCNIPSSFEHQYGQIRYTVKAVIDIPWEFDHKCKAAFTVISSLNLNDHRQNCLGIDDEARKDFCCCFFSEGAMNVRISIPSTGYVPGQSINTTFDYENLSDSVEIEALSTKLTQTIRFHAKRTSKTVTSEVTSTKSSGVIPNCGQYTSELRIPPIPPSNLENCGIIDLVYKINVAVHFTGTHYSIERSYPVLIGTVPLCSPASAPPLEAITIVPTAPISEKEETATELLPSPPPYSPAASQSGPHSQNIGFVVPE